MSLFSIIIPIHNGATTIDRCLNSVLNQTESDFEILLIENGSSDCSKEICERFGKEDKRIRVFSIGNCNGPSRARNFGIKESKGEYITFIDCDDFVEPEYLSKLRFKFQNNEVVFMGYHCVNVAGQLIKDYIPEIEEKSSFYEKIICLREQDLYGYTWVKAIKKETIGNKRFDEELNLFEDEKFICNVLKPDVNIGIVKEPIYFYVLGNDNSLMGRTYQDFCRKCEKIFEGWDELLLECSNRDKILTQLANQFTTRCYYYGIEREINLVSFFKDLSETNYFRRCTLKDRFTRYVKEHKMFCINFRKRTYFLKNKIYGLIRARDN